MCKIMATSLDDLRSPLFWRAVAAELMGTMFLVLVGCGSCIKWSTEAPPTIVQISLTFGLAVATMVWGIAHVSGGHINPAVTVAMLLTRKISIVRSILFILAQCIGAIAGAGILQGVTPDSVEGPLGVTLPHKDLSQTQAFGVEFLITFVLVFTVFATCDGKRSDLNGSGPLAIGLSVTLCHLFAINYTGSSMNPARSFGPVLVTGQWHDHWVYWCGPILGGLTAGLMYDNLFAANASLSKAKGYLLASNYDSNGYEEQKEEPMEIIEDKEACL